MKLLLLALLLSSCAIQPKIITPKVSKIVNAGTHYKVYVWYRDSWLVGYFKDLPDSIKKGKRITLYPGNPTFKRTGNQTRPW